MSVTIPGPSQLHVRWGCRRCGFRNGIAKTKLPVTSDYPEVGVRLLLDHLRIRLTAKHYKNQRCLAVADDFTMERYVPPPGDKVAGLI